MDVHKLYVEAQANLHDLQTQLDATRRQVSGLERVLEGLRLLDPTVAQDNKQEQVQVSERVASANGVVFETVNVPLGSVLRDHIFEVLRTSERFLSSQELINHAVSSGYLASDADAAESLRKIVSRMVQEKKLVREKRDGRSYNYGLPQDASSSAVVAAELLDEPVLTPSGGEHTDGQGSHHDHRDDLAGRDGDRDHLGAPVGH